MSQSNKKIANGLVAAGAAAVLAVYAAGYERTRSAADQFDAQSAERRPASPEGRGPAPSTTAHASATESPAPAESGYDWARDQGSAPAKISSPRPEPTVASAPVAAPAPTPVTPTPAPAPAAPAPAHKQEVASTAPVTPSPAPVVAVVTPSPVAVAPPAPVAAPVVSAPTPVASIIPAPAPPAAVPAAPKWKDGTYTGWGTCRHGDIQAQVVIDGGKITSATIAQCLTRYSCNVIGRLPPEVIERQSAEVDYVSGATQSANAFYYAVVEALGKAK